MPYIVCAGGETIARALKAERAGNFNSVQDHHQIQARMKISAMSQNNKDDQRDDSGTGIVTKTKPKTKKPSLYRVLLLNDDYTPMEFVVYILERFFKKSRDEATQIMLHVHQKGVGVCGVFTYEVAETKVTQVMNFARQHQHPLQCTMEKE
jgi:ATP-dependent Clp protease adaptor protein ClpS